MEVYLGTICAFGFNYAPYGWQLCAGQILSVQQYTALFTLLGVAYGGNGSSNFGLPDLQGRAALGMGQGPGLPDYITGESEGSENIIITVQNLPPHSHQVTVALNANNSSVSTNVPAGNYPGNDSREVDGGNALYAASSTGFMANLVCKLQAAGGNTGVDGGVKMDSRRPFLAMNYSICLEGLFPTRS
jgi:microcystin-dependent protein